MAGRATIQASERNTRNRVFQLEGRNILKLAHTAGERVPIKIASAHLHMSTAAIDERGRATSRRAAETGAVARRND